MKKNNLIQNAHTVILSAHRVILSAAKNLFLTVFAIGLFASCQKELATEVTGGKLKNEAQLDAAPALTLRSPKSADGVVNVLITQGAGFVSERIFVTANRPSDLVQTIILQADTTLAEAYRKKTGIDFKVLPEAFYKFDGGSIIELDKDATTSSSELLKIYATNTMGAKLEAGRYLLPIVANSSARRIPTTLYYDVLIREPFEGDAELYEGEDAFFIFYINTEYYDPRLVTDYYMKKMTRSREEIWYNTIGNIINLKTITLIPDEQSGRVILNLGTDMRYVLDHASKYILPLQEQGRKVCISIDGSNKGVGFCNLTDSQIDDLARQVSATISYYHLDGVNLWDKNIGYGKNGFPPFNTTSYPKFIKTLRTYLGDSLLLTVTDYEKPTEYFWDADATEGIEVGRYIDYAWSGYNIREEGYQIIDPYHQGEAMISAKHPRMPILGLDSSRYICINAPWEGNTDVSIINQTTKDILAWKEAGYKNNNICLFEDLRTVLQDQLEGKWDLSTFTRLLADDRESCRYVFDMSHLSIIDGEISYNKWLKDW